MPRAHSEALVTKFLRDALAVNAVGVPELDEKARAQGLLGERQSITTARVFKRAKKSLGITSRRTGFGAQSKWHWQMPPCRLRHRSRWTATSGCRDSLLPTPESDVVYWDAGCPGFGVKITPKGRKVFIVLYRIGGADSKLRKYTIGSKTLPVPGSR